jgi:hypothetical protein
MDQSESTLGSSTFPQSKLEDEPILGTVLRFPDGRIQSLTFLERLLANLGLLSAKQLESRYS